MTINDERWWKLVVASGGVALGWLLLRNYVAVVNERSRDRQEERKARREFYINIIRNTPVNLLPQVAAVAIHVDAELEKMQYQV